MTKALVIAVLAGVTASGMAADGRPGAGGAGGAGAATRPVNPASLYQLNDAAVPATQIDQLVTKRLRQVGATPAEICSDAVFVRRVYLDVIGTLPTAEEVKSFLADRRPEKRKILIDTLLERGEFADYWTMKWSDLLRVKAEFPVNLWPNAAQAYHKWIHASIRDGKPYDRFVRELLTGSGSNFREPTVNFYRAVQAKEPNTLAQAVALTFMGVRAEKWPAEKLNGMAAFFSQVAYKSTGEWKEEIVYFDPTKEFKGPAVFPDGTAAKIEPGQDPRVVFAEWLTKPGNPYLAKAISNRVWSWLLGRGIIHEVDDIRPDNRPSNPELLAYLERELISSKYDLKSLYRLILNSQTYQRSSITKTTSPAAETNFAYYPMRRLDAEVVIDAICQITGTREQYSSAIPEPFTFIPQEQRSIMLPDGSIGSPFLELFGRAPRDSGLESERNNKVTAAQRLHLLNSSHIQRKIGQAKVLQEIGKAKRAPREAVAELYLAVLSRYPSEAETGAVLKYVQANPPRDAMVDVMWALMNSSEFLYRH